MKEQPGTNPDISIIIPVLNEESRIGGLIRHLRKVSASETIREIIVVDGGSSDHTCERVHALDVVLLQTSRGRARQMNAGAQKAKGNLLYFLHADTYPPENFDRCILQAYQSQKTAGCFRLKFDDRHWFLTFFSWFSRFNYPICRGGDQSLFITKEAYLQSGGFDESYIVYEDNEFIQRLYRTSGFWVLPLYVTTSARKYRDNGMFRLQYHFGIIQLKHFMGAGPDKIYAYYRKYVSV